MKKVIKVNNYNISNLKFKNWNFIVAGSKARSMKAVKQALNLGIKNITATYKKKL